jgi:hypothetical protein
LLRDIDSLHLLNPISVVVTPHPLPKEHMHDPMTINGRLLVMVPANISINARPIVRSVYAMTVIQ